MSVMTATAATNRKPYLTIRPSKGWVPVNFRDIWLFRDLLTSLGIRDTKLRYRQTALGAAWVVIQPLMAAGLVTMIFSGVAHITTGDAATPYFIFALAGQLAWIAFNSTLTKTSQCLVANAALVSKVYFPRLVLPLSSVYSTLVDFGVALIAMLIMLPLNHIPFTWHLLLLPIWFLLLMALSMGVGLYSAALSVTYRDVNYVVPILVQLLMYAAPIVYPISQAGPHVRAFIFYNPLTGLVEGFRWSLLGKGELTGPMLAYSVSGSLLCFIAGAYAFRRMEKKFADII
jgi:lipopolysaccharide transport system permease protein